MLAFMCNQIKNKEINYSLLDNIRFDEQPSNSIAVCLMH